MTTTTLNFSGTEAQIPLRLQHSIDEAAELLHVSKHTLIRDIRLGKINTKHYGKRVLIPRDELLRIASEGM